MRRAVKAVMWINVAITAAELSRESAGQYLFTMIAFVLAITAAPYLAAAAVMRRVGTGWARAIGSAACTFGLIDAAVRIPAFFFPSGALNRGLALWLPIYALAAIPLFSALIKTFMDVLGRKTGGLTEGSGEGPAL